MKKRIRHTICTLAAVVLTAAVSVCAMADGLFGAVSAKGCQLLGDASAESILFSGTLSAENPELDVMVAFAGDAAQDHLWNDTTAYIGCEVMLKTELDGAVISLPAYARGYSFVEAGGNAVSLIYDEWVAVKVPLKHYFENGFSTSAPESIIIRISDGYANVRSEPLQNIEVAVRNLHFEGTSVGGQAVSGTVPAETTAKPAETSALPASSDDTSVGVTPAEETAALTEQQMPTQTTSAAIKETTVVSAATENSDKPQDTPDNRVMLTVIISAAAVVLIAAIIGWVVYRRKRSKASMQPEDDDYYNDEDEEEDTEKSKKSRKSKNKDKKSSDKDNSDDSGGENRGAPIKLIIIFAAAALVIGAVVVIIIWRKKKKKAEKIRVNK